MLFVLKKQIKVGELSTTPENAQNGVFLVYTDENKFRGEPDFMIHGCQQSKTAYFKSCFF